MDNGIDSDINGTDSNGEACDSDIKASGPETKGTKRTRTEYESETPKDSAKPVHELLVPRATSRGATPDPHPHETDIDFFDDKEHEEYEWVRLPKKRDYDLYRALKRRPEERDVDDAELPLTAIRHEDGAEVTLWAKMDTGSDTNWIHHSTLQALFGDSLHRHMRHMTKEEEFNLVGANHFDVRHCIKLDFYAGHSKKLFEKVHFVVFDDDAKESSVDGIPNVLLGMPFLREHSMIQIDLEYCHGPNPDLPVLAKRAEDEKGGHAGPLPVVKVGGGGKGRPPGFPR